jgi:PhnB protein
MARFKLVPYLFFKGNAKAAMEFYKDVFGGELVMMKLGESPKDMLEQMKIDESRYGEIMHARLSGGSFELLGSDSQTASDHSAKVELSINGSSADEAKMKKIFDRLAEGGKVRMPLSKQFWGDTFGMLTDKYGVDWMMNIGDSMS